MHTLDTAIDLSGFVGEPFDFIMITPHWVPVPVLASAVPYANSGTTPAPLQYVKGNPGSNVVDYRDCIATFKERADIP